MREGEAIFNSFGDSSTVFSFFPSESHKKAVHRITVGFESKCGLVMLTGEIGTGKTTLFRHIQRQHSDKFIYSEVGNPFLSPMEQVSHFCRSFGLKSPQSLRQGHASLTSFFEQKYREGKQVVLIFDETHLLTKSHWGQILVFSNLRENDEPIVQILLVGQTELVDRLMEPGLEALNQRIGIRCELSPLSLEDTRKYIQFKLNSSGVSEVDFQFRAMNEVWKLSGGVPRLINHACSHLLDQIVFSGVKKITAGMVKELSDDGMYTNLFASKKQKEKSYLVPVLCVFFVSLLAAASLIAFYFNSPFPDFSDQEVPIHTSSAVRGSVEHSPLLSADVGQNYEEANSSSGVEVNEVNSRVVPSSVLKNEFKTERLVDGSSVSQVVTNGTGVEVKTIAASSDREPSGNQTGQTVGTAVAGISVVDFENSTTPTNKKSATAQVSTTQSNSTIIAASSNEQNPVVTASNMAILKRPEKRDVDLRENEEVILDGRTNPEVRNIEIGAVAYNKFPDSRIAVLNQTVMREGDVLGDIELVLIDKEELIFLFKGNKYRRVFVNNDVNHK